MIDWTKLRLGKIHNYSTPEIPQDIFDKLLPRGEAREHYEAANINKTELAWQIANCVLRFPGYEKGLSDIHFSVFAEWVSGLQANLSSAVSNPETLLKLNTIVSNEQERRSPKTEPADLGKGEAKTKQRPMKKIEWKGSQKELAELFVELQKKVGLTNLIMTR